MDIKIMVSGMCLVFAHDIADAYRGILRNKPINSTPAAAGYYSKYGTDGIYRTGFVLTTTDGPFFQVDLQELYIVTKIIVVSQKEALRYTVRRAKVGVSKNGSSFFQCGQFPNGEPPLSTLDAHGFTVEFPCSRAGPVRYVKIWQESKIRLALWEIDADGFKVPTCAASGGILRNKPINSTADAAGYYRRYGTDGRYRSGAVLTTTDGPFFQVDLQELYIVFRVIVTCAKNVLLNTLKTAMIGVSKSGDKFTICGQWPNKDPPKSSERIYGFTLEFPCLHAGPVRYVKLWKETSGRLGILEMDAEGFSLQENAVLSQTMRKISSTRVQNSTSVSVSSLIHCAKLCRDQFCRFLSYSAQHHPNCLLADSGNTVRDLTWGSWSCSF